MHTNLDWEVHNEILTQTLVGPSPDFEGSALDVDFIDKGTSSHLIPERVYCTFGRNELTILKYVYVGDGSSNEFNIYVRVNDNWELTHGMDIE